MNWVSRNTFYNYVAQAAVFFSFTDRVVLSERSLNYQEVNLSGIYLKDTIFI